MNKLEKQIKVCLSSVSLKTKLNIRMEERFYREVIIDQTAGLPDHGSVSVIIPIYLKTNNRVLVERVVTE